MKYIFKTILLFLLLTAVPQNAAAEEPTVGRGVELTHCPELVDTVYLRCSNIFLA